MFQADQSWEYNTSLGVIFNRPGLRTYPFIEVGLNAPLFHVDAALIGEENGGGAWTRIICSRLIDVLEIIKQHGFSDIRISVQTPRNDEGYRFFSISDIIEGTNAWGDVVHLFLGARGEEYLHSYKDEKICDLLEKRTLWNCDGNH